MPLKKRFLLFFLVFLLFCGFNIVKELYPSYKQDKKTYREGELLVKFKKSVGITKAGIKHSVVGAKVRHRFHSLGIDYVSLPEGLSVEQAIAKYKSDPDVEYVEPNYIVKKAVQPNDTYYRSLPPYPAPNQWGLIKISPETAWDVQEGSYGVKVAVLDTGVDYNHLDLKENVSLSGAYNFVGGNYDPMDDDIEGEGSHGTHVSGIIGAIGNNNFGITGVNWKVTMVPYKVLDNSGSGSISDIISAISEAKKNGIRIVNMSFETEYVDQVRSLCDAMQQNMDILFVAAAGNSGKDLDKTNIYPASCRLENLISVSATTEYDNIAYFANYGINTVHIAAPGVNVYSTKSRKTMEQKEGFKNYSSAFFYENGTSMAAPFVTGVAALIMAQYPNLSVKEIKERILKGVDNINLPLFTKGRLNASNALKINLSTLPPLKPENLSLEEPLSAGKPVKLKWFDLSSVETGYKIERKLKNDNNYAWLVTLAPNTTNYQDIVNLQEGDKVSYRVMAENSNGQSEPAEINLEIPLNRPTLLSVSREAKGVRLNWQDNTQNEDGYEIWRQAGTENYYKIGTVGRDVTTYLDENINSNTYYYYKVRAYNNQNVYSDYSAEVFIEINGTQSVSNKKCFIATAAYGTPFHSHLDVLRGFRDRYLMSNSIGKRFVDVYYKYSPPIAEVISKHILLRVLTLLILVPLVYALKFPLTAIFFVFLLFFVKKFFLLKSQDVSM